MRLGVTQVVGIRLVVILGSLGLCVRPNFVTFLATVLLTHDLIRHSLFYIMRSLIEEEEEDGGRVIM